MHNGCILCGGVGTGKSRTSLSYYILNEHPRALYIITTARKRDTSDWIEEVEKLGPEAAGYFEHMPVIDSWNNIRKYIDVKNAFFIFDEQRVVGYGAWVKAFLKIVRQNRWVLLSATPGDTWMDYIPVFIANGFYKNKRDFVDQHVVYSNYTKYPKVERFLREGALLKHRREVIVDMAYQRETIPHIEWTNVSFNATQVKTLMRTRWDPFKEEPIQDGGALCYALRRCVNDYEARYMKVFEIMANHPKAIIFYNFDYELEGLRKSCEEHGVWHAEWNGHQHDQLDPPKFIDTWAYLVQYTAGAEGWNCTMTDTIIFFSQNYSYKTTIQAAGRIDRLNTPFRDLYYFHLFSASPIDLAIRRALMQKKNFNEKIFLG